ncbi:MAG TPA: hypothetical protein ENG13_03510 [bacterium]|nr:hypothetical protein [bacterium]HEX68115.1 hypothetical protein [bacterium]
MTKDEKWLLWGFSLFAVGTLVYWGILNISIRSPSLLTSKVESFINQTLIHLGLGENNLIEKFSREEKGRVIIKESFMLEPNIDVEEMVGKLKEKMEKGGYFCKIEKKGNVWEVKIGRGNYLTHVLTFKKEGS